MSATRSANRRDFLKKCLTSAAVLGASGRMGLLAPAEQQQQLQATALAKPRVVVAHDAMLRGAGATVDSHRMLTLLDRAMQALFDRDNPLEPWKKLVRPGEMVGVKVNALGGRGLSSNVQLVEAICERLQEAGIKASDIVVWDRDSEELERVGFRVVTGGNRVQCFGTDRVDYEQELVTHGSVGSRLSRILTERCNVLINVPVLKDHDGAGVTMALKNMYGVIHNPNKYHPNGCNPYIADLNMLPEIRTKMRLTICDATTACFEGGPGYKPEYSWKNNGLIVSQDPVALDYTGWQIIERKRTEKGLKTLEGDKRAPHYIATAADALHRLGTNDPKRIAVVEV
ncbi:MAG: DUF362 domain-containing protein [Acidobacteriia bacterium]|nr:DUF362 domain-containing protein [Terriglobia bacterium]